MRVCLHRINNAYGCTGDCCFVVAIVVIVVVEIRIGELALSISRHNIFSVVNDAFSGQPFVVSASIVYTAYVYYRDVVTIYPIYA